MSRSAMKQIPLVIPAMAENSERQKIFLLLINNHNKL